MFTALWKLTWLEIKIFLREPMGAFGTIAMPVLIFLALGRLADILSGPSPVGAFLRADLPVLIAVSIALNTVLSLVTIISIYREGGILKRLRATPLRPWTILSAHVLAKLILTGATLALMAFAGRPYLSGGGSGALVHFAMATLLATWSILAVGFVIASMVPTARFAQTIGGVILYPMLGLCGLFYPVDALPPALETVARLLPLTYAVSLLRGMWAGDAWAAHAVDVAALLGVFLFCILLSTKAFRWE